MTTNHKKCPVCKGNKVVGIPGRPCKYCDGTGIFELPPQQTTNHEDAEMETLADALPKNLKLLKIE